MKYIVCLVALFSVAGCYGSKSLAEGDGTVISSPAVKREFMSRWNQSVDENPSSLFDFHWQEFDHFPHPTYAGEGSMEGYQAFGQLLLAFLEKGDNFDYLAQEHLFDASLYYKFQNGDQDVWSLRLLVNQLSDESAFGIDEATRAGLSAMASRIDAAD